jgi:hypothetical protein
MTSSAEVRCALSSVGAVGESPTMRVTFDTNVWNRMVFPERWLDSPNYDSLVRIKDAIRSGQVRGFRLNADRAIYLSAGRDSRNK